MLALGVIVVGIALTAWRRFPWTYSFAAIILVVFVLQILAGPLRELCTYWGAMVGGRPIVHDCITFELGFRSPAFLSAQQWWSPLSATFVHGGLLHLIGNLIFLYIFGSRLEDRIGPTRFAAVFLLAGAAGALATIPVVELGVSPTLTLLADILPTVGASGAIFGLIGVTIFLFPREMVPVPVPLGFIAIFVNMPAYLAGAAYLGFEVLRLFMNTNVAWWGHLGGFLLGAAMVPYLRARLVPAFRQRRPVDVERLRPLAASHQAHEVLAQVELLNQPRTRDDREFQEAWLERFFGMAQCPACGQKDLALRGSSAESACGYRVEFR